MKVRTALATLLLSACAAPQPTTSSQQPPSELVGRTAGAPQDCVSISQTGSLRVSENDRHTLLYDSGRTIWANPLGPSCGFSEDDVLVTEVSGSYYCRGDLVRSIDRTSHIPGRSCVLSDFVPYRR